MIPLSVQIYERGSAGVPTTSLVADLRGRADSYEHTISDRFGFESMTVSMRATGDEIYDWLQNGLGRSVVVYSPNANVVWEGQLETISANLGQKKASKSFKNMANRVRTKYTSEINGSASSPATTATVQDTVSQGLYGIKDRVVSLGQTATAAAVAANQRTLNSLKLPRSTATTQAKTGSSRDTSLQLTFAGWYATLDWIFVPSTFDGSGGNAVSIMIGDLLTSAAGINAFVSTDASKIASFGYSLTNFVPRETTFRQQFDKYFNFGDNSNNQFTWGIYEDRILQSAVWAGATPDTIAYREDARTSTVFDPYYNVVAPWDVRPNAMSEMAQALYDVGPPSGSNDSAARKYVARVVCSISNSGVGCSLEPSGGDDLERAFAALASESSIWN